MGHDAELVRSVIEDLNWIRADWGHEVDDATLRRGSAVLRRLLIEGDLRRAWRAAGRSREPLIESATLDHVLGSKPLEDISFASAGGGHFGMGTSRGLTMLNYAASDEEVEAWLESMSKAPEKMTMGLSRFVKGVCMVVAGTPITRHQLIKYVANKLGGAHFDSSSNRRKNQKEFRELSRLLGHIRISEKEAVYFELLSIGQALVTSESIQSFAHDSHGRS